MQGSSQVIAEPIIRDYGVKALVTLLWTNKFFITLMTIVFAIVSVVVALNLPNKYQSEVLLDYVRKTEGGLGGGASQIGQLANLAGLSLGSGGGDNREAVDMATLTSRKFLAQFIERHNILVPLFATKEWDVTKQKIIINPDVYDESTQTWLRKVKYPLTPQPSAQEAVRAFNDILVVGRDKSSGLINVSITFLSPVLAQQWLELLIIDFNEFVRLQEIENSERNINYLKLKAAQLNNANIKSIFFNLLEDEYKNMMLAQVSKDYVLKTVDPSLIPQQRSSPKRALICVGGTIFGMFFGIFIIFLRHFLK